MLILKPNCEHCDRDLAADLLDEAGLSDWIEQNSDDFDLHTLS